MMRKLLTISFLVLISACVGKPKSELVSGVEESSNVLERLKYLVDTLMVDSGEEIFNLKDLSSFGKSNYFSRSDDEKSLYFFDRHRFILHEINLDSLKLINNYPFEEEGPDGIGRFVYTFKSLPNGNFYGRDLFGSAWFFSKTGKKLIQLNLNGEELLQSTTLEPFSISNKLSVDLKGNKIYSLPSNFLSSEVYLAVMDSLGQTGKTFELSQFKKTDKYKIEFNGNSEGGETRGEQQFLQQLNELVLLSSTVCNDIYIYDPQQDSLYFKSFPHELVPLEKDVEVKNKVFNRAEFQTEADKLHTQIDYWDFYWDAKTERYYRFASKGLPLANIDSPKKYEYFMFAYDKDLTLKGETKLEGLSELPLGGFFKDGKLYSYVNVEDELGFAVFTFDF